jgi:hypothetical protein
MNRIHCALRMLFLHCRGKVVFVRPMSSTPVNKKFNQNELIFWFVVIIILSRNYSPVATSIFNFQFGLTYKLQAYQDKWIQMRHKWQNRPLSDGYYFKTRTTSWIQFSALDQAYNLLQKIRWLIVFTSSDHLGIPEKQRWI